MFTAWRWHSHGQGSSTLGGGFSWAGRGGTCPALAPQSSQPASQLNPPLERSPKPLKMLPTGSTSWCWGARSCVWTRLQAEAATCSGVSIARALSSHMELLVAETSAYLANPKEQCKEIHNTQEAEVNVIQASSCSCLNTCPNPTTPVLICYFAKYRNIKYYP